MPLRFEYETAFSRNLGWLTEREQATLRGKRVAIAGMGGVGGAHLLMLTRLGIGSFSIADPDCFEVANFNRQVGAKVSTLGRRKVEVMAAEARDINPQLDIDSLPEFIDDKNIDLFLAGADLFVDGLDFFALDARARLFERSRELGIPALTAAPVGMGVAYLVFTPDSMSFEEYFGLADCTADEKALRFLCGLVPKPEHHRYLVDPSRIDLNMQKTPSTPIGCQLAAAIVGTEAARLLLGRPGTRPAPHHHLFDAYSGRVAHGHLSFGYRHPLQRIRTRIAERLYLPNRTVRPLEVARRSSPIERVLDQARWAPSGDNGQPWRFSILDGNSARIHVTDESEHDVYDRDGEFSLVSAGCLLENVRLAAADEGRDLDWQYRRTGAHEHEITVELALRDTVEQSDLIRFIRARATDRFPYRMTPLSKTQKRALEGCLDGALRLTWFETLEERLRISLLNAVATDIRLRCPEAHAVHQRVIDFERLYSPTGIPSRATGLDPLTLRIMRWAMKDFSKIERLNSLMGTGGAQLQMDLLPGLMCGAHFMFSFQTPSHIGDRAAAMMRAGQSIQRFWLEATRLGLSIQPGNAPLIFGTYGERNSPFTKSEALRTQARELAKRVRNASGGMEPSALIFAGRIGIPRGFKATSRSIRRPLEELVLERVSARSDGDRGLRSMSEVEMSEVES
jgi:molybdopterin/thiamine biosynthesis adenylyltransferase